ncbi:iron ABC transporter permease [Limibaculum sp. FT325]|uniref:ABC transporter permease n=1 Tax=Thermohalobaculum sediminis TaxID=2939436 RepID=UPI0020BE31F3|nr:iron ABC transporter permease [Limibaculum sediminis]MCL5776734.1 iron ABC transporter permease [Limibaculum sediminis]
MVGDTPTLARPLAPDGWTLGSLALAGLLLMPLVAVAWMALFPTENIWPHLVEHALPVYLSNTLILMGLVGVGAACVGTGAAWLVVMTEFPGRRVMEWALLAPLAMPAYIGAYALVDMLEYAGPVQTGLRALFGWSSARDYWFPEIRSLGSAVFVLTITLYPYVYLLTRAAFREQSVCVLEVGRSLGCGPWGVFFRVGLPLARPAVAAGTAIVAMETLNDFGAVDYFGVPTLTRGIFSIWLDTFNAGGAAQIACVMLVFVLALLAVEKISRRGRKFFHTSRRYRPIRRADPGPVGRWLAFGLCLLPVLMGFVAPAAIVGWHALDHLDQWLSPAFWRALWHTAALAGVAAGVSCLIGVFLVYGARASRLSAPRWLAQATALGYAAPGAVLAVGVLIPFAALDNMVADFTAARLGFDPGLILTGSAAAVVFAYVVRFAAIAHGAIDSAFGRVTPSMELAARTLGETRGGTLHRVHLPLIRGSVLTAALLIFVDAVKELPATLILRPFNFETLATTVYGAASLEQLDQAGPAALAIVVVGLLPVVLIVRTMDRSRPGEALAP